MRWAAPGMMALLSGAAIGVGCATGGSTTGGGSGSGGGGATDAAAATAGQGLAGNGGSGGSTTGADAGGAAGATLGGGAAGMDGGFGAGSLGGMTPLPTKAWDIAGIVGTGQSLSVGVYGTPTLTTQPYQNLKLSLGSLSVPPYEPASALLSLVPLVEPIRPITSAFPSAYPNNIYGETPHTSMGNELSALFESATGGAYVTVHTVVGESGQPMSVIDKAAVDTGSTGHAFAASLFEVAAIARLARAAGKTYGVGAITLTHGETDAGNLQYESELAQLWSDYNATIRPLTGQAQKIPLLLSQQNSSPNESGSRAASDMAQWRAGLDHPGDVICIGPKYQYPYYTDGLHLLAEGYDLLGEKYAEVYFEKVVRGIDWQPLEPTGAEHAGNVITVHFHVPVAPLVWDSELKDPHQAVFTAWKNAHGFEVADQSTAPIVIQSASIVGSDVQLTCATDPGAGAIVRYAATADGTPMQGGTARWGTLRDSDPFIGATSEKNQPNYAVAFELQLSM